jgi:hypothetical protein
MRRVREVIEWILAAAIVSAAVYATLWVAIAGPFYLKLWIDRG